MGREIRRVPPPDVWLHPTETARTNYPWNPGPAVYGTSHKPLLNSCFCEMYAWWEKNEKGTDWDDGPPEPADVYRPHWEDHERTWVQLYETVSEGTPLTPPMPTREALRAWLLAYGDDYEQRGAREDSRPVRLPSKAGVDALLNNGWGPSMTATSVTNTATGETRCTDLRDAYGDPVGAKHDREVGAT